MTGVQTCALPISKGRPVGQASVYRVNWEERTAEVGRFLVAPEAAGQGYIGLACAELLRFCADTLSLKFVFLVVKENNEKAIRLYARNGFREEESREEERAQGMVRMSHCLNQVYNYADSQERPLQAPQMPLL